MVGEGLPEEPYVNAKCTHLLEKLIPRWPITVSFSSPGRVKEGDQLPAVLNGRKPMARPSSSVLIRLGLPSLVQ
jgi:hypothetical protein